MKRKKHLPALKAIALAFTLPSSLLADGSARAGTQILRCDVQLSTENAMTHSETRLFATPYGPSRLSMAIFTRPSGKQIGDLEFQVLQEPAGQGAWAPRAKITAYPQYMSRTGLDLSFVAAGRSAWKATFHDVKRADDVVYRNPVGLSGSVDCRLVEQDFGFIDLSDTYRESVILPGYNDSSNALSSVSWSGKYCVFGRQVAAQKFALSRGVSLGELRGQAFRSSHRVEDCDFDSDGRGPGEPSCEPNGRYLEWETSIPTCESLAP